MLLNSLVTCSVAFMVWPPCTDMPDFTAGADTLAEVNIALPAGSGFVQPTANAQTVGNLNVIDNSAHQYILHASVVLNAATGSSLFDPMFRGCRIAYTLS